MKTSRWLSILLVIVMVLAMSTSAFAAPAKVAIVRIQDDAPIATELVATHKVADLNAGQYTDVGDLLINSMGGNTYLVTYQLELDDYYFGEIHFEAISDGNSGFTDDSAIIYSNGGIVPGKLTVNESFDMPEVDAITGVITGGTNEYSFIYKSGAPVDSFAAHSVVCLAERVTDQILVQNGTEIVTGSAISDAGMPMVGGGFTVEVREPFDYPDETSVEYNSVWDEAFDDVPAFNNKIVANGAQMIWNDLYSSGPVPTANDKTIYGDVLKVDVPIVVDPDATNIVGTLYIVSDNAYIARINSVLIGSAGFDAFKYAEKTAYSEVSLTEDELLMEIFPDLRARDTVTGAALFTKDVVDSGAWKTMITTATNVPLTTGPNFIEIAAMNEYMGPLDGQGNGTYSTNPAGVIFFIEYTYDIPHMDWEDRYSLTFNCETAWGMGTPVNGEDEGGNWSQIIPNTEIPLLERYRLIEEVDVPSTTLAGVTTTAILITEKIYELRASGTFDYSSDIYDEADAEWFEKAGGWIKGETGVYADKTNVIDVSVNGDPANDDWGDYNPAHEYTMKYTGVGLPLHLFIFDTNYIDNSGFITVEIWEVLY